MSNQINLDRAMGLSVRALLELVNTSRMAMPQSRPFVRIGLVIVAIAPWLNACASSSLTQSGKLSSYEGLQNSDGILTKTRQRLTKDAVLSAKSVRIVPTDIAEEAAKSGLAAKQLRLVANAIDRSMCSDLSARFEVVTMDQPADLTVQAVITRVGKTDVASAGLSKAASIGGAIVNATTGVPVPVPRIPLGMGALSVEAQAKNAQQQQVAAMTWARGADSITTKPRMSEEADAYTLADEFSADWAKLLVSGSDPMKDKVPTLPTAQSIKEHFGGKPKYAACEAFGNKPGMFGMVAGQLGLPPEWSDKGARTNNH